MNRSNGEVRATARAKRDGTGNMPLPSQLFPGSETPNVSARGRQGVRRMPGLPWFGRHPRHQHLKRQERALARLARPAGDTRFRAGSVDEVSVSAQGDFPPFWKGRKMKLIALSAAITLMATVTASGDDVPFAAPPLSGPGQLNASVLLPSLGDIMAVTQIRHIKLWYAGKSSNWDLVNYELDRIIESLNRAALLYSNIPVEFITGITSEPVRDMRDAAKTKNVEKFIRSYSELTTACNSCHSAGHVGFIRIQGPTSSPFSDENYGNER
jgi:hypothetical protein